MASLRQWSYFLSHAKKKKKIKVGSGSVLETLVTSLSPPWVCVLTL